MDIFAQVSFAYHKLVDGNQGFSSHMEKIIDRFIVVPEHKFKVVDFVA